MILFVFCNRARAFSDRAGQCTADAKAMASSSMGPNIGTLSFSASVASTSTGAVVTFNGTADYKGLLLYFQDGTGKHVGTFNPPTGFQTLDSPCPQFPSGSTLSHSNNILKNHGQQFIWNSNGAEGILTLTGMVVGNKANEWQVIPPVQFSNEKR